MSRNGKSLLSFPFPLFSLKKCEKMVKVENKDIERSQILIKRDNSKKWQMYRGEKMPDFGHPIQGMLDQEKELQDKDHLKPPIEAAVN